MKLYRWRFSMVYGLLCAIALASAFYAGLEIKTKQPKTRVVRVTRAPISPKATLAQVKANFAGKPYVSGTLTELPGFQCVGYTAGNAATDSGWVVIRCQKGA